jgi:hypothetical protein
MGGAWIWLWLPVYTGREAWDSPLYFVLIVLFAMSGGLLRPRLRWVWGITVVTPQVVLFLIQVHRAVEVDRGRAPLFGPIGVLSFGIWVLLSTVGSLIGASIRCLIIRLLKPPES